MPAFLRLRLWSSPMFRATWQAAILSGISNILAQFLQSRRKGIALSLDTRELLRFVFVTLITAPPNYLWQQYLERTFPAYNARTRNDIPLTSYDVDTKAKEKDDDTGGKNVDSVSRKMSGGTKKLNWRNTIMKMLLDCITLGALVNTVLFLLLMGVMKGHDRAKLRRTIAKETLPVIISGYKLWPLVSLVSFILIPVERRIVFFSIFGLGWNIYLSLIATAI